MRDTVKKGKEEKNRFHMIELCTNIFGANNTMTQKTPYERGENRILKENIQYLVI